MRYCIELVGRMSNATTALDEKGRLETTLSGLNPDTTDRGRISPQVTNHPLTQGQAVLHSVSRFVAKNGSDQIKTWGQNRLALPRYLSGSKIILHECYHDVDPTKPCKISEVITK